MFKLIREKILDLTEKRLNSETVFKGKLLHVLRDMVSLPDGAAAVREYITHPGAVVVIALKENGKLLFERQFRYPVGQVFLELPAGKIDAGEDITETARRELLEETGYIASEWRYLGVMHPCIGYANERIEIFLATGLTEGEARLDEGEFLELTELSLEEAREAVREGQITDAKTITCLFWADGVLNKGW